MIEVNVKVNFPDECLELLTTKDVAALVIPMTAEELMHARAVVADLRGWLEHEAKAWRVAKRVADEKGDSEPNLSLMVEGMFEQSQAATEIFESLCLLLARAVARNLNFNAEDKQ